MRTLGGALLASTLLVSGCSGGPLGDDERRADVGEVFPAQAQIEGLPVTFTLPTAGYEFLVSKPRSVATSSLPMGEGGDVSPEAGDGTAFIEIDELTPSAVAGDTWMLARENVEWNLWLDVDGRRFPLDREAQNDWVVTVPEDPDEVRLVVDYDGRELAVDPYDPVPTHDTGSAYAPGHLPRLRDHQCPPQRRVELADGVTFNGTDCQVRALDPVPWFGPAGWAAPGRSWVLVKATIDINTYFGQEVAGEYVSRDTAYGEPTYRLDGARPVAMYDSELVEISSRPDDMDVHDARWLLFEVAEDTTDATLRLGLTYTGTPRDPADDATVVTHRWKHVFDLRLT
ncbi:hypothetical protein ncot_03790 [Nocardioides sp. JQ2195]|uniref:hypothetical protein n=1 Tax=Nocardioides sp. JQ2195 TaxID=2592334 RepID=UPI00143E2A1C|nr:hypothetical protein [Nocardioides sp. JQ2195]QIX25814.1 hypothetical protein ncot_03790 [Nocardioides sp. JQ2195]